MVEFSAIKYKRWQELPESQQVTRTGQQEYIHLRPKRGQEFRKAGAGWLGIKLGRNTQLSGCLRWAKRIEKLVSREEVYILWVEIY